MKELIINAQDFQSIFYVALTRSSDLLYKKIIEMSSSVIEQ